MKAPLLVVLCLYWLPACSQVSSSERAAPAASANAPAPPAHATDDTSRLQHLAVERSGGMQADREYRIGPGDTLKVTVFRVDALNGSYTVERDGTILFPLLASVDAAGKTEQELSDTVSRRLGETYLEAPNVRISVERYGGQRVAVLGAVGRPGFYPLESDADTVLDVLNRAGGLKTALATRLLFTPANGRNPDARTRFLGAESASDSEARDRVLAANPIEIDLTDLHQGKLMPALGLPLRSGDLIYVEEASQVIVEGWVAQEGAYPLRPGTTLVQAITRAGGLHFGASSGSVSLSRKSGRGPRESLDFDYGDLASGRVRDVYLQGGDRIHVGGNPVKVGSWGLYKFVSGIVSVGIGGTIGF